jgi:hypothetical protein
VDCDRDRSLRLGQCGKLRLSAEPTSAHEQVHDDSLHNRKELTQLPRIRTNPFGSCCDSRSICYELRETQFQLPAKFAADRDQYPRAMAALLHSRSAATSPDCYITPAPRCRRMALTQAGGGWNDSTPEGGIGNVNKAKAMSAVAMAEGSGRRWRESPPRSTVKSWPENKPGLSSSLSPAPVPVAQRAGQSARQAVPGLRPPTVFLAVGRRREWVRHSSASLQDASPS